MHVRAWLVIATVMMIAASCAPPSGSHVTGVARQSLSAPRAPTGFAAPTNIPAGPSAFANAEDSTLYDYDGDGKPDVVMISGQKLKLFHNNGNGTTTTNTNLCVQIEPIIALDCAFAHIDYTTNEPGFACVYGIPTWGVGIYLWGGAVAAGADGVSGAGFTTVNGRAPLAPEGTDVTIEFDGTASVWFAHNGMNMYQVGLQGVPAAVTSGDFDGDGSLDVAVSLSGGAVQILLGPEPSFHSAGVFTVGAYPTGIAAGDFDGDGKLDLVTANNVDSTLSILKGDGTGKFTLLGGAIGESVPPKLIATADLDDDGKLDLVYASDNGLQGSGVLSARAGNGDGTFGPVTQVVIPAGPYGGTAVQLKKLTIPGDLDGDGNLDVLVTDWAGATALVVPGTGGPHLLPNAADDDLVPDATTAYASVDVNGDGKLDLVYETQTLSGNVIDGGLAVRLGHGDGTFGAPSSSPWPSLFTEVRTADFDGDGKLDVITNDTRSSSVFMARGNGDGSFQPASVAFGARNPVLEIGVGDFNGDGKPDLVVPALSDLFIALNKGDGTFTQSADVAMSIVTYARVGDLNGDGRQDVVTFNGSILTTLIGNGDGTFVAHTDADICGQISGSGQDGGLSLGDVNGDGHLDVAYTCPGHGPASAFASFSTTLAVRLGSGIGTFGAPTRVYTATRDVSGDDPWGSCSPQGGGALAVATGGVEMRDANGDGKLDLLYETLGSSTDYLLVNYGVGDGTFGDSVFYPYTITGITPRLAFGDYNSDGVEDLIVGPTATIFYGKSSNWSPLLKTHEVTALAYVEGMPAIAVTPRLQVKNPDVASTMTGATVTIGQGYASGQDVLAFTPSGGITGAFDAASGTLRLTGNATADAYQTALRSVTYINVGASPSAASRTIAIVASNARPSQPVTRTLDLTPSACHTANGGCAQQCLYVAFVNSCACSIGYTLAADGKSCPGIPCGSLPSAPSHGSVTAPSPGAGVTGDSVSYACNAGYALNGGATATCQASGSWSAAPTCIPIPLSLAPADSSVTAGTGVQFSATGGVGTVYYTLATNASGATINAGTGAYVAGSNAGTDIVRVYDTIGATASARVVVSAVQVDPLVIGPGSASTPPRGSVLFTATGGVLPYTFDVLANGSGGVMGPDGHYVAGPRGDVIDTVRVTDATGTSASATVRVSAAISITPDGAAVGAGSTTQLTASGGTGGPYTWTATAGSIDASGNFTARAGSSVVTIEARDGLGNTASVAISVGGALAVSPDDPTTYPQGKLHFTAFGGGGSGYSWVVLTSPSVGGTIDPATGDYVAGPNGNVQDTIQASDRNGNRAVTTITVGPGVSISPPTASVAANGQIKFSAAGGSGVGYAFSIASSQSGASVSEQQGVYTAGATGGVDVVKVTDSASNVGTATVTAAAGPAASGSADAGTGVSAGGPAVDAAIVGNSGGSGGSGNDCAVSNVGSSNGGSPAAALGLIAVGAALARRRGRRWARAGRGNIRAALVMH